MRGWLRVREYDTKLVGIFNGLDSKIGFAQLDSQDIGVTREPKYALSIRYGGRSDGRDMALHDSAPTGDRCGSHCL